MNKEELKKRIQMIDPDHLNELVDRFYQLRLIDDQLMNIALKDNPEAVQEILRPIIGDKGLKVQSVTIQEQVQNYLNSKAVRLDVVACDSNGRLFDIEMQRAKQFATPKRARVYLSLLDNKFIKEGTSYEEIRDTYVIFIVDGDYFGGGDKINHTVTTIEENGKSFVTGQHVIYLNCSNADSSELGKLMSDLRQPNAELINNSILAKAVAEAKGEEEKDMYLIGSIENEEEFYAKAMAKGMAEGIAEGRKKGMAEGREKGIAEGRQQGLSSVVKNMFADGLDLPTIAKYTALSEAEVKAMLEH